MRSFFSLSLLSLFLSTVSSAPLSQLAAEDDSPIASPGPVPFPIVDEAELNAPTFQHDKLPIFAAQQKNPAVAAAFERLKNGATPRLGRRDAQAAGLKDKRQDPQVLPTPAEQSPDQTPQEVSPVELPPAASTDEVVAAKGVGFLQGGAMYGSKGVAYAKGMYRSGRRKRNPEDNAAENSPALETADITPTLEAPTTEEMSQAAANDTAIGKEVTGANEEGFLRGAAAYENKGVMFASGRYRGGRRKRSPEDNVTQPPPTMENADLTPTLEAPTAEQIQQANDAAPKGEVVASNGVGFLAGGAAYRNMGVRYAAGRYRSGDRKRSAQDDAPQTPRP
ncbi:MAG: hypothetical protein Q9174_004350 [Haloplaca sp. 1 TL-2023]